MNRKSFALALVIFLCFASFAYAAVVIKSEGTHVGPTDKIDTYGPAVTQSGGLTTMDFRDHTGDLTVDGEVYSVDKLTVSDDIYALKGVTFDGAIYLTGDNDGGMYRPLILRQSDGGCSACGVDTTGTTFSCQDIGCPSGMSQE